MPGVVTAGTLHPLARQPLASLERASRPLSVAGLPTYPHPGAPRVLWGAPPAVRGPSWVPVTKLISHGASGCHIPPPPADLQYPCLAGWGQGSPQRPQMQRRGPRRGVCPREQGLACQTDCVGQGASGGRDTPRGSQRRDSGRAWRKLLSRGKELPRGGWPWLLLRWSS